MDSFKHSQVIVGAIFLVFTLLGLPASPQSDFCRRVARPGSRRYRGGSSRGRVVWRLHRSTDQRSRPDEGRDLRRIGVLAAPNGSAVRMASISCRSARRNCASGKKSIPSLRSSSPGGCTGCDLRETDLCIWMIDRILPHMLRSHGKAFPQRIGRETCWWSIPRT